MPKIKVKVKADELRKKLNIKDGKDGLDGKTPIPGVDFPLPKNGKDGRDGKDGKTPDTSSIVAQASKQALEAVTPLIPTIEQIEADLPRLGTQLRDSLELLSGEERLSAEFIKDLEKYLPKAVGGGSTARNFYQLYDAPQSYVGQTLKALRVNAGETALEFYTPTDVGFANPMTTGGDLIYGGASGVATRLANGSANQVLISNGTTLAPSWASLSSLAVTSITGTANQVIASSPTGAVTLSLPQDIATGSSPTFTALTLSGLTSGRVPFVTTAGLITNSADLTFSTTAGLIGNDSGGTAVDFRWEGDTEANLLFIDANGDSGNGQVMIGTGTANAFTRLTVKGASGRTGAYISGNSTTGLIVERENDSGEIFRTQSSGSTRFYSNVTEFGASNATLNVSSTTGALAAGTYGAKIILKNISANHPLVGSYMGGIDFVDTQVVTLASIRAEHTFVNFGNARDSALGLWVANQNTLGERIRVAFYGVGLGVSTKLSTFTVQQLADVTGIGALTTANAATAIVGTSATSRFLTTVGLGDRISLSSASSTYGTVTAITDDTNLTVDTALGNGTSQTINVKHAIARLQTNAGAVQFLMNDQGNLAIGDALFVPAAKVHIVKTTEQLRLGYDLSNYFSTTISSVGNTTFDLVGTSPEFTFSDPVNINGLTKTQNIYPTTDDTYYLGKNDDDSPLAYKGVILKDTTNGKYYRIEVISGVVTATDLTD